MRLGSVEVSPTTDRVELLSMLLWGKPACGKTVLASTAPGKKLWMQFDKDGTASLRRNADILVADFSGYRSAQLAAFKQGDVVESDLIKLIKAEQINTVVVDSLTSFGQLALHYSISSGKANRGTFKASIEAPGQTGYGVRSAMLLDFVSMVLRVCADLRVHCIFTAHDQESMDEDGKIAEITLNLGGQGRALIPAKISEIWHIEDTGSKRLIYTRAHGIKRPMRSRMFLTNDKTHFVWDYNQDKNVGHGIKDYYQTWCDAGFDKVSQPRA